MYPGSSVDWSNGGARSLITPASRRTSCLRTASIARSGPSAGAAPGSAAQLRGLRGVVHDRGKPVEDLGQEPAEPHALAPAPVPDAVHAVVPVAGPDERQAVRAVRERPLARRD